MTLQVGVDLVAVESISESLRVHGEHYLQRVYTDREVGDCRDGANISAERLAARFAAKEAAMKALRMSPDEGIGWRSFELVRDPDGWTTLELSGGAAELARSAGVAEIGVSITHDGPFAVAVVVVELRGSAEHAQGS